MKFCVDFMIAFLRECFDFTTCFLRVFCVLGKQRLFACEVFVVILIDAFDVSSVNKERKYSCQV